MQALIPRLLISLLLTAGQSVYLAACAESTEKPEVVALAQPAPAQMKTFKNTVPEEPRLVQIDNQVIPGVTIYSANIGGDEASRLAKDGVFIGSNTAHNFIDLQGGNILLNPEKDIVVGSKLGKVFIGAGANVFIVNSGPDLVVYDLLQTKPKQVSVIVKVNKYRVPLEPGRMLVLTEQAVKNFEKLEIDCHRVTYHNPQTLNLRLQKEAVKAFAADFSIASAMVTIQPLKGLTLSSNKQDKLAVEKLVKGAVLMGDFATGTNIPDSPALVQTTEPIQVANGNHQ
jgi:hypothetical protein